MVDVMGVSGLRPSPSPSNNNELPSDSYCCPLYKPPVHGWVLASP